MTWTFSAVIWPPTGRPAFGLVVVVVVVVVVGVMRRFLAWLPSLSLEELLSERESRGADFFADEVLFLLLLLLGLGLGVVTFSTAACKFKFISITSSSAKVDNSLVNTNPSCSTALRNSLLLWISTNSSWGFPIRSNPILFAGALFLNERRGSELPVRPI